MTEISDTPAPANTHDMAPGRCRFCGAALEGSQTACWTWSCVPLVIAELHDECDAWQAKAGEAGNAVDALRAERDQLLITRTDVQAVVTVANAKVERVVAERDQLRDVLEDVLMDGVQAQCASEDIYGNRCECSTARARRLLAALNPTTEETPDA